MPAHDHSETLHLRTLPKHLGQPATKPPAGRAERLRQALRDARVQSQVDLAQRQQLTPRAIAKTERHTDLYVSTLRRCIEDMGGTLEIVAHFPDGWVTITYFGDIDPTFRL